MQRIPFVNNQPPALNAHNLNLLQDYIEQAINGVVIEKDFIVVYKNDNQTIPGNNTWTKYNLNAVSVSQGTKLTFDTTKKCIVVGADISYLKVSAQMYAYENTVTSIKDIAIWKNTSQVARGISSPLNSQQYYTIPIPEIIIPVQQGDEIYLYARSGSQNAVFAGSNDNGVNYLCVEEI